MSTFRIAWRNIWRNSRRTWITFAAAAVSTALLVTLIALMDGMVNDMVHSVTDISLGQVQVHHPEYRGERSIYDTIEDPGGILDTAAQAGIPASARAFGFGLLSGGKKSAGAQFWGIDPEAEQKVSDLADNLLSGTFLTADPQRKVILGRKLARTLNASIGDELVVVVQASDGSMGNELYFVAGILKSVGEAIDRSVALIHQADFEELFVMSGKYHQIVFNSYGSMEPDAIAAAVTPSAGDNEVQTWKEIIPPIAEMLEFMDAWMLIFGVIFFTAAGLGVLNTMLMATYERIPEFGLLKAIGTTPWRIVKSVSAEALVLGLASSLTGGVLGIALSLYFSKYPIDLSAFGEGFMTSGIAFSPYWYAELSLWAVFMPVCLMGIISFLAALYPAAKAARLDPVKAMHHV